MDTRENQFVNMTPEQASKEPGRYIPFEVGEEIIIKSYRFWVARVKVGMNEIVLKPLGLERVGKLLEEEHGR